MVLEITRFIIFATPPGKVHHLLQLSLSVCLSVTFVFYSYMVQDVEICFAAYDSALFLVLTFTILSSGIHL